MLSYYRVPQIAARKVKQAEWKAFLGHSLSLMHEQELELLGISHDLPCESLSARQLERLAHLHGILPQNASTADPSLVTAAMTTAPLTRQDLLTKLRELMRDQIKEEALVLPVIAWDIESADVDEAAACNLLGLYFLEYEVEYWW